MNLYVIGGHSGDEAVMAGALVHKYVKHGHKAFFVGMTNGAGGHPTLSKEEYRIQKDREAAEAAAVLGAEPVLFPFSSRELVIGPEPQKMLADVFKQNKPDVVITHWRHSLHADHRGAHYNTLEALILSGNRNVPVFFAENWEDNVEFSPSIHVFLDEDDIAAWEKACNCFQFVREKFYKFRYTEYYKALMHIRGLEVSQEYATALMPYDPMGRFVQEDIPGFPF